jgi:hypothetical protein
MKIFETLIRERYQLLADKNLGFDQEKSKIINSFLNFCYVELKLQGFFTCKIVSDRKKHNIVTTAYFNPSERLLAVYGLNRMLGDILRSIGHELTHLAQFEQGRIKDIHMDGSDGSDIENEANAKAGELIRKFGRNNKTIFQ